MTTFVKKLKKTELINHFMPSTAQITASVSPVYSHSMTLFSFNSKTKPHCTLTAEHQTAWKKMEHLTAEEPHTPPQELED